jgi:thymidylate synthase
MKQYLELMQKIVTEGNNRGDRTGVGTRSLFGEKLVFDLQDGFPLLTTKTVHFPGLAHELIWFLRGCKDSSGTFESLEYLHQNNVHIWDMNVEQNGNCVGPIYGSQWRSWYIGQGESADQMQAMIDKIKSQPEDRRLIVSAWNVAEIPEMCLPPCHVMFQCYVEGDKLSLQMYQRSADYMLGVPFNIASYALLMHIIAHQCGLTPSKLHIVFGDVHLYQNHLVPEIIDKQLARTPGRLPLMVVTGKKHDDVGDYTFDQFELTGYHSQGRIKAELN